MRIPITFPCSHSFYQVGFFEQKCPEILDLLELRAFFLKNEVHGSVLLSVITFAYPDPLQVVHLQHPAIPVP